MRKQIMSRGIRPPAAKSCGMLIEDRRRCADCGRTPLIGERVHLFPHGEYVCELCRPAHRGQPASSDLVKHFEAGLTVKRVQPVGAT